MQLKLHEQWPETAPNSENPFISRAFLAALNDSHVCEPEDGWKAQHLELDNRLYLPAYLKGHSWGEYVFDWAWAQAYEQHHLDYYPKLIIAAPFTPSQGPRLLGAETAADADLISHALKSLCTQQSLSGFHILFPNPSEQRLLNETELLRRTDVQFHWYNQDYRDFDDFLDRFSSRKRKNVRRERRSMAAQGIRLATLEGSEISDHHWDAFYRFYHATYLKRGRAGYLNRAFFDQIRHTMADQIVLVMAEQHGDPVAGALFFKDQNTLYGRYWGCLSEIDNLHFEACYYQGIEYCIKHQLKRFDPGTQGEHKIARGFEPTYTHSYHWLQHPEFFQAAKHFCDEEARMTADYFAHTQAALPFKCTDDQG
ncbi:GNAT family N-acetyltransferase [Reinekea blandensis]|uniref:N-acetyltransferase n=1 Tax=Reinekea blandensis MED297 TaxID=314283 RepID=A4BC26_9GAMM|nr:GNAT family N-acetyltransferase [Reinekea blandensis]EAR10511.1 hypothetical protein MED297_01780 [Reinekea sp. MED297] [Reinekea blandensis MED297]